MFSRTPARVASVALGTLGLAAGCTVTNGTLTQSIPSAVTSEGVREAGADAESLHDVCDDPVGPTRRDIACHAFSCERRVAPATWDGDVQACALGTADDDARARALAIVNAYRWLADLPPVVAERSWETAATQCAVLAHANGKLSHEPPRSWKCWSELASKTSAVSLIANRSAPISIDAFFEDPGNEETMVHRRWLLSGLLTTVAVGSTDKYACVVVDGRGLSAITTVQKARPERAWAAWPPAGPVPIGLFAVERLDTAGWTIQSSNELGNAQVTVTSGGRTLPVRTTKLEAHEGSRSALRFVPSGWTTAAESTYAVHVAAPDPIDYVVEPVTCP